MDVELKKTNNTDKEGSTRIGHFPLHELDDFFEFTTLEEADKNYLEGAHRHNYYEILWFTETRENAEHYIDFNRYAIARNHVFLLLPNQVHSIDAGEKRGFLMSMSKDFFENQIGKDILKFLIYSNGFSVVIPSCLLEILKTLVELIRNEYLDARRPVILESYLRSWFLHCVDLWRQEKKAKYSDVRLGALVELIDMNFRKQHKAHFYAKCLSMSAKRLNELTRKSFEKTINQMINERIVLEAKREIGWIGRPIKEICYGLGFSEPSYFTRFFNKHTGYSPKEFRKRVSALEH